MMSLNLKIINPHFFLQEFILYMFKNALNVLVVINIFIETQIINENEK